MADMRENARNGSRSEQGMDMIEDGNSLNSVASACISGCNLDLQLINNHEYKCKLHCNTRQQGR